MSAESAQVIAIAEAKLSPREREAAQKRRNIADQAKREGKIAIHTKRQALAWGDSWVAAYLALERHTRGVVDDYEWKMLMLQSDLTIERARLVIERIEAEQEIKRLRGLLA